MTAVGAAADGGRLLTGSDDGTAREVQTNPPPRVHCLPRLLHRRLLQSRTRFLSNPSVADEPGLSEGLEPAAEAAGQGELWRGLQLHSVVDLQLRPVVVEWDSGCNCKLVAVTASHQLMPKPALRVQCSSKLD